MKREIFEMYLDVVLSRFRISDKHFFQKNKKRLVANARYLLYYLCEERGMKLVDIQEFMEEYGYHISHAPIRYGISKMAKVVEEDRDYKALVDQIKKSVTIN